MTFDPLAPALHHEATLGGTLTPEEQERLQKWYAKTDEEEAAMFAKARERESQDDSDACSNRSRSTHRGERW